MTSGPRHWRHARSVRYSPIIATCARKLKPDFAFVLGRHCDMADAARFLIDSRIPFAIEKPCAVNAAEAQDIAQRAAAAGVFAAVPLVFRYCPIIDTIREIAAGEAIQYLSFKFVGGMVDRYYQQKVEWVIDRTTSGGGPLLNLGIHFVDLCRVLLGNAALTVTGAMMSNRAAGLTIEDHAIMLMQGGGASCMVETGYLYPAPNSVFDMHYSIRTRQTLLRRTRQQPAGDRDQRPATHHAGDEADERVFLPGVRARHVAPGAGREAADRRPDG